MASKAFDFRQCIEDSIRNKYRWGGGSFKGAIFLSELRKPEFVFKSQVALNAAKGAKKRRASRDITKNLYRRRYDKGEQTIT